MEKRISTIIIPEGNDFIYCLTITGFTLSNATNMVVYASTNLVKSASLGFAVTGSTVKIPFHGLKQGDWNLWVSFTYQGRQMSFNYRDAFKIVGWNNQFVNWGDYAEGSEIAVRDGVYITGSFNSGDWTALMNDMAALTELKNECESAASEAHDAAEYAREQGDAAKDAAENASEIYETVKDAYESGEFKGETGETGSTGAPGADGSILYPAARVDSSGYLVIDVPETAGDNNVGIDKDGYLFFEMPEI